MGIDSASRARLIVRQIQVVARSLYFTSGFVGLKTPVGLSFQIHA
jgi:hypothetical protein